MVEDSRAGDGGLKNRRRTVRMLLCEVMRPAMRALPRGGTLLYRLCGGTVDDEGWRGLPNRHRILYDRKLRAYVCLDLGDRRGRSHYFVGQFLDPANQELLAWYLRPGDTFIDVGAHIGLHTLHASRLVGASGHVLSFEPHPRSFGLLQAHLAINRVDNCRAMNLALSDEAGELTLSSPDDELGTSTLRLSPGAIARTTVRAERAERVIDPSDLAGRVLIKIDTEGFEHKVIRGLGAVLQREDVGLCVEVTDRWLREAGSSANRMFEELRSMGYSAFRHTARRAGASWRLELVPLEQTELVSQYDAFFVRPASMGRP